MFRNIVYSQDSNLYLWARLNQIFSGHDSLPSKCSPIALPIKLSILATTKIRKPIQFIAIRSCSYFAVHHKAKKRGLFVSIFGYNLKMKVMTKEQLIQIAKAGFPERVKESIDFENAEIHSWSGVYRLYNKTTYFKSLIPNYYYIAVVIGDNNFIQITTGHRAFNHYLAIKEMEKMGLIKQLEQ